MPVIQGQADSAGLLLREEIDSIRCKHVEVVADQELLLADPGLEDIVPAGEDQAELRNH